MSNDKDLIDRLGGSAKVAEILKCSVQRVQNWKERGIPAKVKLERPDLFLSADFNLQLTDRIAPGSVEPAALA